MITYLAGLRLKKNDTVILDLTCNFAQIVIYKVRTESRSSLGGGGGRTKKFQLCDLEGRKVASLVPGNLMVNLAHLPGIKINAVEKHLTDFRVKITQHPSQRCRCLHGQICSVESIYSEEHCDLSNVAGPRVFLRSQISNDHLHPSMEFLTSLSCAILLIRRKSQSTSLPMIQGMLPAILSFSSYRLQELEMRKSGDNASPD